MVVIVAVALLASVGIAALFGRPRRDSIVEHQRAIETLREIAERTRETPNERRTTGTIRPITSSSARSHPPDEDTPVDPGPSGSQELPVSPVSAGLFVAADRRPSSNHRPRSRGRKPPADLGPAGPSRQ